MELRGHQNVVRKNVTSDSAGYSVKIASDDEEYDKGGNVVKGNTLSGSRIAMTLNSAAVQGLFCGNIVATQTLAGERAAPRPPAEPPDHQVHVETFPFDRCSATFTAPEVTWP